jgi:hypothetical protein
VKIPTGARVFDPIQSRLLYSAEKCGGVKEPDGLFMKLYCVDELNVPCARDKQKLWRFHGELCLVVNLKESEKKA